MAENLIPPSQDNEEAATRAAFPDTHQITSQLPERDGRGLLLILLLNGPSLITKHYVKYNKESHNEGDADAFCQECQYRMSGQQCNPKLPEAPCSETT